MVAVVTLPPKSPVSKSVADRSYRTAIRPDLYVKLEQEAQERGGLTPYKLTQIVMTMYLQGQLVVVEESNAELETADES